MAGCPLPRPDMGGHRPARASRCRARKRSPAFPKASRAAGSRGAAAVVLERCAGQRRRVGPRMGQANLRDLLPDRPEAFAGECGVAEVSRERRAGQGQPPHRRGPGVGQPRPGGGDPRDRPAARPARHHGLAWVPGRLRLRGRAGAGRHRGAVRHPRGSAALAQAVLAGAPREAGGVAPTPPRVAANGGTADRHRFGVAQAAARRGRAAPSRAGSSRATPTGWGCPA